MLKPMQRAGDSCRLKIAVAAPVIDAASLESAYVKMAEERRGWHPQPHRKFLIGLDWRAERVVL